MITFVSPQAIYDLRLKILREGKPLDSVKFVSDFERGSFHLGKFIDDQLIGVVSYLCAFPVNIQKTVENPFQLRGMAIDFAFQKQGFGEELCKKGEKILQELGCDFVWCNARTSAKNFYTKQNFALLSEEFMIEEVGPHFAMGKLLLPE